MKNSCPWGLFNVDWIQIRPPVSFSPSTLTSQCHYIQEMSGGESIRIWKKTALQREAKCINMQCQSWTALLFFLYCYRKELWDFITWFLSVKTERCVLCASRRKQALKSFSCCLPFLLPRKTPQVHQRFWPDLWPLSSTSQTSGDPGISIHFENIPSVYTSVKYAYTVYASVL